MVACFQQPDLALKMLKKNDIDHNIQDNYGNTGLVKISLLNSTIVFIDLIILYTVELIFW
jgi:hypothetical protein